jgi:membrane-associated protease RseP (regulator of RpoE activity)
MDERRPSREASEVPGPPLSEVASAFRVAEVRQDGERLYYLGTPLTTGDRLETELWPLFRDAGYEVSLSTLADSDGPFESASSRDDRFAPTGPQYVLEAKPRSAGIDGIPWTNVVFFVLTVLSTLLVGTQWYYIPLDGPLALLKAWPFAAAVLGVLAVHELGHYVMIRYHDVDASLPYFIPFPSIIGTMGAVIRMRGRIPDRKALFDIGVAGPLAGLGATVVVTLVGLYMDPIEVPREIASSSSATEIQFNYPLLLQILQELSGQPARYPGRLVQNPVIIGGWVGMFVTFLNLLPVGQFDGGHIVRAILGPDQERVAAAVPAALFGLAGYLYVVHEETNAVVLWGFWGVLAIGLAYMGPAAPIRDEAIGPKRKAVGALTLVLGLLCFTPVPFEIMTP